MKIYTNREGPEGFRDGTAFVIIDSGKAFSLSKNGEVANLHKHCIKNAEYYVKEGYWKQVYPTPKIYNHMLDVAFTVEGPWENWDDIPYEEKIEALEKRLNYLKQNPVEGAEAFGYSDSYEID
jgi:ABC-type tungstate transport system permease subunit